MTPVSFVLVEQKPRDNVAHSARRAKERLHAALTERRSAGQEHVLPLEGLTQRNYADFALPLRYSHQNQYENINMAASRGDKPFMQLFSSRMIRLKLMQNQRRQTMPFMSNLGSSSTPTATFPGSDLLYGSDGLPRTAQGSDELAGSDISGYERDRQRLRDLEIGNKRPTSRSKRPAYAVVDKVSFDRERDDARSGNNSLPVKAPAIRNGIRNSLVRGEQLLSQRNSTGSNSGRDPDDLIAMGTLWSPANNNVNNNNNNSGGSSSNGQTRSSSNTTNSNKSIPAINNNTANNNNNNFTNGGAGGGSSTQRKPISVSLNSGRLGHSSSFNGISNVTSNKLGAKDVKEVEPKYNDPLIGAPASFQQRLMELASLEAETIRWERIKKVKKKPKQDRDS